MDIPFGIMAQVPGRGFPYVSQNPEKDLRLQILVCGKTGTGKSALINSVVGRQVCESGGPGNEGRTDSDALDAVTKSVNAVHSNSNGIIITVWDSPGLQDGTSMEKDYLQDMYDKCKNVDLVYYCIDMTTSRWTHRDKNAIGLMAEKFDATFWSKCILVLTKANSVRAKGEDKKAYFEKLYNNFMKQFQNQLQAHNVSKDVSTEIPATCAGIIDGEDEGPGSQSHNERYLYYTSNREDYSDGKRKHFLSELWLISFQRLPNESRLKYMCATGDRERFTKDIFTIIEEMCASIKEDEVKANHTSKSQNKSKDEVEDAEEKNEVFNAPYQDVLVEREDAEKSQSTKCQNKSEDEIEDAEKNQSGESQNKSVNEIEDAKKNQSDESQNKSDEVEDTKKKKKVFNAPYQDVPVEREDAEKRQSSGSQNKSEDEIEDAEKNQNGESQNTSEDEIADADRSSGSEDQKEVFNAPYQDVPLEREDAEKRRSSGSQKNKSEDEIEDAEKNQNGESQNTSEDELEDAEKYQSGESEDQKKDAEEKNKVFYEQNRDVPVAKPIKGTDLPMDDSQKNRLKKISVRKNVKRGAIIGGIAGSVLPIAGSLVGAAVGAGVGAVIAKAKKKKYHK